MSSKARAYLEYDYQYQRMQSGGADEEDDETDNALENYYYSSDSNKGVVNYLEPSS